MAHLSESGVIAVVAGTVTASDRASPIRFLAGLEASLEAIASYRAVLGWGLSKRERCEGYHKAEADEGLHDGNN